MALKTWGSSTAHSPTYAHSSVVLESSFLAWEGFHRLSQSSVNCSKKSALMLEGCEKLAHAGIHQAHCLALIGDNLTVKVGFSMAEAVLVSSTEVDEESTASSVSSARTWPSKAAEE